MTCSSRSFKALFTLKYGEVMLVQFRVLRGVFHHFDTGPRRW